MSTTRVVIIAGPTGSGKTTILTSLYESFLEAPFANFLFGGSRTLVGFERRCHPARSASGRQTAHTTHTPVDVVDFLHLKLTPASPSVLGSQSLLLSDISGERFKALRDSTEAVKKLTILKRADHLCMVLDGEKLANPSLRQAARSDARMMLRSIVEAKALSAGCKVAIVFAKWDVVLGLQDSASALSFVNETLNALKSAIGGSAEVNVFEIAARPTNTKIPFAFGLPTLLRHWLQEPEPLKRPTFYLPQRSLEMRESERFATTIFCDERKGSYHVEWV